MFDFEFDKDFSEKVGYRSNFLEIDDTYFEYAAINPDPDYEESEHFAYILEYSEVEDVMIAQYSGALDPIKKRTTYLKQEKLV